MTVDDVIAAAFAEVTDVSPALHIAAAQVVATWALVDAVRALRSSGVPDVPSYGAVSRPPV